MTHLSYALFDDEWHARAALDAIEAGDRARHRCAATLHKDRLDEGILGAGWTSASRGMLLGAAMGGAFGAISGGLMFGHIPAAGGGALVGAIYGAIAGALQGSGAPSRKLESLSKQVAGGKVLLTVHTADLASRDAADATMRASGAKVEHRASS
jgi:hypothetical protein